LLSALPYIETPLQEISDPILRNAEVRLIIKREDLNHPLVSGNKWWKLKYNLAEAKQTHFETLLTFGGAYSNHIYATAAAAYELGFKSIGIIRGEETHPLNPTLTFSREKGMHLQYVSRHDYRNKTSPEFIDDLQNRFGKFYIIPEGGTNVSAIKGCIEFAKIISSVPADYVVLPVGTAGTISGIITGLRGAKQIVGIPVLKNGTFLYDEINHWLKIFSSASYGNWSLLTSYHHGGYAKTTPALLQFIAMMQDKHDLPLDPVYTGKLLWAVFEETKKGNFKRGSTILAIHTGGLQGASTLLKPYEENAT